MAMPAMDPMLDMSASDVLLGNPDNEDAVLDFVHKLESHQHVCMNSGRYDEAELARTRLEQLRLHEANRLREEVRSEQLSERLAIEEAHMKELQEFNAVWDEKVREFEDHSDILSSTLQHRQRQELEQFIVKCEATVMPRVKHSKQLLNLRHIEKSLARQKKYAEADSTKRAGDELEAQELAAWEMKRNEKISNLEEKQIQKHDLEMQGLLKRIKSGREEQKLARKQELQRLLQRYHNVKTQLESTQNIVRLRQEKTPIKTQIASGYAARPMSRSTARFQNQSPGVRNVV